MKKKRKKYITRSNISEKAKKAMKLKLIEQIKAIKRETTPNQVNKLNSIILGMHNYYRSATQCSLDFGEINYIVSKSLRNRLKGNTKESKVKYTKTYQKFYGDYNGTKTVIAGIRIFPIHGCKFRIPLNFSQEINNYTKHGRELIHSELSNTNLLVQYLLKVKEYDKSVEYNDNRISLMAGQQGKCAVTNEILVPWNMECHHKKPKELGGTDEYKNLVWLKTEVHKLIHAIQPETIKKYLKTLILDKKALKKINSLRLSAGNLEICQEY